MNSTAQGVHRILVQISEAVINVVRHTVDRTEKENVVAEWV